MSTIVLNKDQFIECVDNDKISIKAKKGPSGSTFYDLTMADDEGIEKSVMCNFKPKSGENFPTIHQGVIDPEISKKNGFERREKDKKVKFNISAAEIDPKFIEALEKLDEKIRAKMANPDKSQYGLIITEKKGKPFTDSNGNKIKVIRSGVNLGESTNSSGKRSKISKILDINNCVKTSTGKVKAMPIKVDNNDIEVENAHKVLTSGSIIAEFKFKISGAKTTVGNVVSLMIFQMTIKPEPYKAFGSEPEYDLGLMAKLGISTDNIKEEEESSKAETSTAPEKAQELEQPKKTIKASGTGAKQHKITNFAEIDNDNDSEENSDIEEEAGG